MLAKAVAHHTTGSGVVLLCSYHSHTLLVNVKHCGASLSEYIGIWNKIYTSGHRIYICTTQL